MSWFDAGVNLLDRRFNAQEIVTRAIDAGVSRLCIITTHPNEWEQAVNLHNQFPQICCFTIGIHPHNAKDALAHDFECLREFAQLPGAVAIGECGLDFNRNFSPKAVQISVFESQLEIASELNMPVYLHERDAFKEQFACLDTMRGKLVGGIAHCFTGNKQTLDAYLNLGLYIGVTGWVCDENRGIELRSAVPHIPLNKIILETDAPYLYPKTLRPRKRNNEPAFLPHIGEQVSDLLEISSEKLRSYSYVNACRLFSLSD